MPFAGSTASSRHLTLEAEGLVLPAQISAADQKLNSGRINASALVPLTKAGNTPFKLKQNKNNPVKTPPLRWEDDGQTTLSLYEGNRLVFAYHYGVIQPPQGVPSHRARSSYFHPLKGLDGETFTQDFPGDHHHHRGFFHAWPGVFIDNQRYDMWHIMGMWTKFERILVQEEGPVFATVIIQSGWYTVDRKVMDEVMEVKVWHSDATGQAMDVNYTWTPAEHIKIAPKDKKGYGGVNFRFPSRKNTVVTTIEGVQQRDSDLKRSPWADLAGQFEGRNTMSGVTIFNHPGNIDANPGWILRIRDHYGYTGVSWPGIDTFDFLPGRTYNNKYRLWLHRGDAVDGKVKETYESYANPPTLQITR